VVEHGTEDGGHFKSQEPEGYSSESLEVDGVLLARGGAVDNLEVDIDGAADSLTGGVVVIVVVLLSAWIALLLTVDL